jgi:CRISPR-associated exonuclease Cas4
VETAEDTDRVEVPISALEHWSYCPRQCALIHVEQTFDENVFTVRGHLAHRRVDAGGPTVDASVPTLRSVALWSERYGLQGRADAIEMRGTGPFPVEYKVGPHHPHSDIQLCAQALCLEEMFGSTIPAGAIYSYAQRRRDRVGFTEALRAATVAAVDATREMLTRQLLPAAPNDARCRGCSLIHACLPGVVAERARSRGVQAALFRPVAGPPLEEFENPVATGWPDLRLVDTTDGMDADD